ncbi:hypothetical protein [Parasitella parasitica]|uniref:Uncharacterized protein n=1 Tax=Parasitella parasitica TaxID=35722 RepID=A0A0B7NNB9_9FUNG|nr:hypothetical protein [Parasitella parasitica]
MSPQQPFPELRVHVVRNNKKGRQKKQQQNVSFNPTVITPPASIADSSQDASAATLHSITYCNDSTIYNRIEEDSVFIDLTTINSKTFLKA